MTKAELVAQIAAKSDLTKASSERALNAILEAMKSTLAKEGKLTLTGFGTLAVETRKARTGRNPRTGKPLKIPAAKVVKFRVGKNLKNAVQ